MIYGAEDFREFGEGKYQRGIFLAVVTDEAKRGGGDT